MDSILNDVKKLARASNSPSDTIKMINIVEKAKRDLERLGHEEELCNRTTISVIEESMTQEMMNEWVKLVSKTPCSSIQKFTKLLEFLREWRSRLEYMGAGIRAATDFEEPKDSQPSDNQLVNKSGSTHHVEKDRSNSDAKKSRCWFHMLEGGAGDHPIWRCKAFLRKNTQERQQLAKENKACFKCLLTTCPGASDIDKCVRDFQCPVYGCAGKHNRLLHVDASSSKSAVTLHSESAVGNASANNAVLAIQPL